MGTINLFGIRLYFLRLPGSEIDIWTYPFENQILDKDFEQSLYGHLNDQERFAVKQYKFLSLVQTALTSKAITKIILSHYMNNTLPKAVNIYKTAYGKPFIKDAPLHFSISHSKRVFSMAVSDKFTLGIDVEDIANKNFDDMAPFALSKQEQLLYHQQAASFRESMFLSFWTRKEALVKAIGTGLPNQLDLVDTSSFLTKAITINHATYQCKEIPMPIENCIAHIVWKEQITT